MSKTDKIVMVAAAGAIAGLLVYAYRRYRSNRMLKQVAAEGYETAHEVLFPHSNPIGGGKTHYGPVLPHHL
ncbi:MAG: hypothetical protein KF862_11070 [Chitinophagaceae bacterium]|nr:hypothetical protein [Chitinophagaceae bacterium]